MRLTWSLPDLIKSSNSTRRWSRETKRLERTISSREFEGETGDCFSAETIAQKHAERTNKQNKKTETLRFIRNSSNLRITVPNIAPWLVLISLLCFCTRIEIWWRKVSLGSVSADFDPFLFSFLFRRNKIEACDPENEVHREKNCQRAPKKAQEESKSIRTHTPKFMSLLLVFLNFSYSFLCFRAPTWCANPQLLSE